MAGKIIRICCSHNHQDNIVKGKLTASLLLALSTAKDRIFNDERSFGHVARRIVAISENSQIKDIEIWRFGEIFSQLNRELSSLSGDSIYDLVVRINIISNDVVHTYLFSLNAEKLSVFASYDIEFSHVMDNFKCSCSRAEDFSSVFPQPRAPVAIISQEEALRIANEKYEKRGIIMFEKGCKFAHCTYSHSTFGFNSRNAEYIACGTQLALHEIPLEIVKRSGVELHSEFISTNYDRCFETLKNSIATNSRLRLRTMAPVIEFFEHLNSIEKSNINLLHITPTYHNFVINLYTNSHETLNENPTFAIIFTNSVNYLADSEERNIKKLIRNVYSLYHYGGSDTFDEIHRNLTSNICRTIRLAK